MCENWFYFPKGSGFSQSFIHITSKTCGTSRWQLVFLCIYCKYLAEFWWNIKFGSVFTLSSKSSISFNLQTSVRNLAHVFFCLQTMPIWKHVFNETNLYIFHFLLWWWLFKLVTIVVTKKRNVYSIRLIYTEIICFQWSL